MNDADKPVYICDPEKNVGCRKSRCKLLGRGDCETTIYPEHAMTDKDGRLITLIAKRKKELMLPGTKKRIAVLEESVEDLKRRNRNLYQRINELTDCYRIEKIVENVLRKQSEPEVVVEAKCESASLEELVKQIRDRIRSTINA